MITKKIGIIGCGNMGGAIFYGTPRILRLLPNTPAMVPQR